LKGWAKVMPTLRVENYYLEKTWRFDKNVNQLPHTKKRETMRSTQNESLEANLNQATNTQLAEISASELKQRLDNGDDIQIIDVREQKEFDYARIPNSALIPLGHVVNRMAEIDPDRDTVVHCKLGGRSAKAIELLRAAGFVGKLSNLKGGITAWSIEVDPSVPKY
jgi:rhodanese-related sulfurtransferase